MAISNIWDPLRPLLAVAKFKKIHGLFLLGFFFFLKSDIKTLSIWGSFRHGQQPTFRTNTVPLVALPWRRNAKAEMMPAPLWVNVFQTHKSCLGRETVKLNESAHWKRMCCLQWTVRPLITVPGVTSMVWLPLWWGRGQRTSSASPGWGVFWCWLQLYSCFRGAQQWETKQLS